MVEKLPANAGDVGDSGRTLEGEDPLDLGRGRFSRYSCLKNPIEEPGRPQSTGVTNELGVTKHTHTQ